MSKQIVVTGIKPTGIPHLGNYLGMIKPMLDLCATNVAGENFIFIANYHALDGIKDPKQMQELSHTVAAVMIGCGLDPEKICFFRESDVPQIAELSTLLMYVCPKGLMNRAHAYKAMLDENRAKNQDEDAGVGMGLYTYPILMAADVLAFHGTHVPVGRDQQQHIEIMRDLAGYFNNTFGNTLTMPEGVIKEEVATLPGLDGRKMSKSYGNLMPIFASEAEVVAATKKIVTDSLRPEDPKDPELNNIYLIYRAIADRAAAQAMAERMRGGQIGYGEAKQLLAKAIIDEFAPRYARYQHYYHNRAEVDAILAQSAVKARAAAAATVQQVKRAMGIL